MMVLDCCSFTSSKFKSTCKKKITKTGDQAFLATNFYYNLDDYLPCTRELDPSMIFFDQLICPEYSNDNNNCLL